MKSFRLLLLLVVPAALGAAEPLVVTKDSASTFYQKFQRLTKEPRYVSPQIALSCVGPSDEVIAKEKARTGPHLNARVNIYVNQTTADFIATNGAVFPVGAVIVKEKIGYDKKVSDIGGMIKRDKGYDPANGDWEYFFYTPGAKFSTGKLANCIDCHNSGTRDNVFNVWDLRGR
jgi:hypothetical protein